MQSRLRFQPDGLEVWEVRALEHLTGAYGRDSVVEVHNDTTAKRLAYYSDVQYILLCLAIGPWASVARSRGGGLCDARVAFTLMNWRRAHGQYAASLS